MHAQGKVNIHFVSFLPQPELHALCKGLLFSCVLLRVFTFVEICTIVLKAVSQYKRVLLLNLELPVTDVT